MRFLYGLFIALCVVSTPAVAGGVQERFNTIKHDAEALHAFLSQWPKGGELHYHLSGSVPPETMLSMAAKNPYCLHKTTYTVTPHKGSCHGGVASSALTRDPHLFDQAVKAWSLKGFDFSQQTGHDHFFATFLKFGKLVGDHMPEMLADVMQRAEAQHLLYAEIMAFSFKSTDVQRAKVSHHHALDKKRAALLSDRSFQTAVRNRVKRADQLNHEAKETLGCSKDPAALGCHIVVKFQNYVYREAAIDDVFVQAVAGFETAHRAKDIVGVNLVQREGAHISRRDYHKHMAIFNYLHKVYPDVHISLHAGELAISDQPSRHIREAIALGQAERIGHGVNVNVRGRDADLVHYMSAKPIPVEINLSSNRSLLAIHGKQHPLSFYLKHKVPLVLSTDDEGILQTNITREYVRAVQEHNVDYRTLKTINRNALTYSFLPGTSIWRDPVKGRRVSACRNLDSARCEKFVSMSEKAKLQRVLEKKLRAFERKYA